MRKNYTGSKGLTKSGSLRGTIILSVRPGAAGLPTNVEYSRVRDSTWYVSYLVVTTRTEVGLVE